MLKIRPPQMQALAGANLRRFVESHVPRLREVAPEQTRELDEEVLVAQGVEAAHQAGKFGIELAGHLRRYLEADVRLGHGFADEPEHAELAAILRDPGLGPDTKLKRIDDYLTFGG